MDKLIAEHRDVLNALPLILAYVLVLNVLPGNTDVYHSSIRNGRAVKEYFRRLAEIEHAQGRHSELTLVLEKENDMPVVVDTTHFKGINSTPGILKDVLAGRDGTNRPASVWDTFELCR